MAATINSMVAVVVVHMWFQTRRKKHFGSFHCELFKFQSLYYFLFIIILKIPRPNLNRWHLFPPHILFEPNPDGNFESLLSLPSQSCILRSSRDRSSQVRSFQILRVANLATISCFLTRDIIVENRLSQVHTCMLPT